MVCRSRRGVCFFICPTGLLVVSGCSRKFSRSGIYLMLDWLSRSHWQSDRPAVQVFDQNPLLEISLNILAV
ncbi:MULTISPECIES: hypothetical protein [unclassified Microcoleus]|uniref:hypothetical protein n=1 Tax=unclassified Microcoleus TaxID=2642155 RepID=UPI002FD5DC43